jgi:thiamine biosynthesis protein ThiS
MANPTTETIEIVLNGEQRQVAPGMNVRELLAALDIPADRVAIEMNREIVRQRDWDSTRVMAGAHFEVVMFVGGG